MDWGALAGALGGPIGALIGGAFGLRGTQETNETNERIANENLDYQKAANKMELLKWLNETNYNRKFAAEEQAYQRAFAEDERDYSRQFAENERDYNRALQQEIFNREDTALERQASSLSSMGINPLSQNMNGLGAGSVVSSSVAPASTGAPSASAGASSSLNIKALHNDYKMENVLNDISPLMSLLTGLSEFATGNKSRDLLAEQADSQRLENQSKAIDNLIKANQYGVKVDESGNLSIPDFKYKQQDFSDLEYQDKNASKNRNVREDVFQNEYKTHDNSPKEELVLTALENQAENNSLLARGIGRGADIIDKAKHPIRTAATILIGSTLNKLKSYKEGKKQKTDDDFAWAKHWLKNNNYRYKKE